MVAAAHAPSEAAEGRGTVVVAFAFAVLVHLSVAATLAGRRPSPPPVTRVTEIELVKASRIPEAEDVMPAPPAPTAPAPSSTATSVDVPPPAARAGALLTRRETITPTKDSDPAPVDFVTDPNGTSYGSGVVATGGTADVGLAGAVPTEAGAVVAVPPEAPRATPNPEEITKPGDLSQAARLTVRDPCRGRYPRSADSDSADVTLSVLVRATGEIKRVTILSETPSGQGFGDAARACVLPLSMEPGRDKAGATVTSVTSLVVHFSR